MYLIHIPNHMSSHTHTQLHIILSHTHTLTASSTSHTHTQSHILSHTHTQSHVPSYTYPTTCPPIHIPNHLSSHTHTQSHVLSHTHTPTTSSTSHTLTQSHILSYTYIPNHMSGLSYTYLSYIPISPHTSITSQSIPIMHNLIASSPISYYYVYIFSSVKGYS